MDIVWADSDDWAEPEEPPEPEEVDPFNFAIYDENHGGGFFTKMQELRESDSLCDFTLTTEDGITEERVHKVILAAASDFFERLFKHEKSATCLEIACRGPVLKHIIDFMYKGTINGPNEDLLEIYRTAHFLLLDRLCEKWIWFLETKWITKARLPETFVFAQNYKLDPIKTVCINFVFSHFSEELFLSCPLELVADILGHEELQISDEQKVVPLGCDFEVAVWELACRWVEQHPENRETALARLTSVICLQCLPEKEKDKVLAVCRDKFQWDGCPRDRFVLPEGKTKEEVLKARRKFCYAKNTMVLKQYAGQYDHPEEPQSNWPDRNWQIRRIDIWAHERVTVAIRFTYVNIWAEDQEDLSEEATRVFHFGTALVEVTDSQCTTWILDCSERIVEVSGLVDDDDEDVALFAFKTSAGRTLQAQSSRFEEEFDHRFIIRSDAGCRGRHQNFFQGFVCNEWPSQVRTLWVTYNDSAFDLSGIVFGGHRVYCGDEYDIDDFDFDFADIDGSHEGYDFSL